MGKFFTFTNGSTYNDADTGFTIIRASYGQLCSVYASTACNYSYREFWF